MHINNVNVNNGDLFYYYVMHTNMPSLDGFTEYKPDPEYSAYFKMST